MARELVRCVRPSTSLSTKSSSGLCPSRWPRGPWQATRSASGGSTLCVGMRCGRFRVSGKPRSDHCCVMSPRNCTPSIQTMHSARAIKSVCRVKSRLHLAPASPRRFILANGNEVLTAKVVLGGFPRVKQWTTAVNRRVVLLLLRPGARHSEKATVNSERVLNECTREIKHRNKEKGKRAAVVRSVLGEDKNRQRQVGGGPTRKSVS